MADIQSRDPLETSAGQPGSSTHRQPGSSGGATDKAQDTLGNVADKASETWDNVSKQGSRYYRQGSQAVGNVDGTAMLGLAIASAVEFGLAWLIFGQQSRSGDYIPRRMSYSSERNS